MNDLDGPLEDMIPEYARRLTEERDTLLLNVESLQNELETALTDLDNAKAQIEHLRTVIQEWSYPRLYIQPGAERETLLAQLHENLTNKVRPSLEAAEERGALWALERHGHGLANTTPEEYAKQICQDARVVDSKVRQVKEAVERLSRLQVKP